MLLIEDLPKTLQNKVSSSRNLWGETVVTDLRPSAGKSAQKSGKTFEDVVEYIVLSKKSIFENLGKKLTLTKNPKFKCHFGLNRQGDFRLNVNEYDIHIEAKQLGNVESHFDKLSHCLLNAIQGCYGNHFWLIYDYNKNCTKSAKTKINSLYNRCEEVKKQLALQGITFELIHIDDLNGYLTKLISK